MSLAGVVCAETAWRHRDGSMFTPGETNTQGLMLCVAALSAVAYLGPISELMRTTPRWGRRRTTRNNIATF